MQVKKRNGAARLIRIFSLIIVLTLSGCNDDVFIDRPIIEISDTTLRAGESTTIKADIDITSYPEMTIYYGENSTEGYIIYNGNAESYTDELLQLYVDIDEASRTLTLTAGHNYYPQDIVVSFNVESKGTDVTADIYVYSETGATFTPGNIIYDLNSWEFNVRWELIERNQHTFFNDLNETIYYPIIGNGTSCEQRGKFVPDIPVINDLLQNDFYDVPVVAFNYEGRPVITDQTTIYGPHSNPDGFMIDKYPLVADTIMREKVMPGQTLTYTVHADAEICRVRYTIPIVNENGVQLTIRGNLEIAVPKKFLYTHTIE